MIHQIIQPEDTTELIQYLSKPETRVLLAQSNSVLVQFFIAGNYSDLIHDMTDTILAAAPQAIVVGSSTTGEICLGKLCMGTITLSFSYFQQASLYVKALSLSPGEETAAGQTLKAFEQAIPEPVKGVEMLTLTTLGLFVDRILAAMTSPEANRPLFGGSAADYAYDYSRLFIFYGHTVIRNGVVVIYFAGETLQVESMWYTGWKPLGIPLKPTKISGEGLIVNEINHVPATDIFRKYLGTPTDENFLDKNISFPFMVKRDGRYIIRTAIDNSHSYLVFMADIQEDDVFYLSYGNPSDILHEVGSLQQAMQAFAPQGIYMFSCVGRREILQNSCNIETEPFHTLAPAAGFYSFGEISGDGSTQNVLNSALVVTGMREGPKPTEPVLLNPSERRKLPRRNLVSRFTHFIEAVTKDYEEKRQLLHDISVTDELTALPNRRSLEESYVTRKKNGTLSSVLLLDIDHFKQINDTFGHYTGDLVLKELADILKQANGLAGRWGGEEFIILLNQDLSNPAPEAERIRAAVEAHDFGLNTPVTISIGAAPYNPAEPFDKLYHHIDQMLYQAKKTGRNRVVVYKGELQ